MHPNHLLILLIFITHCRTMYCSFSIGVLVNWRWMMFHPKHVLLRWFLSIALLIPTAHDFHVIGECTWAHVHTQHERFPASSAWLFISKFWCKHYPLWVEKLRQKLFKRKKNDRAKRMPKTITQGCKLWPWKQRFEDRFESVSFRIVWFFLKLHCPKCLRISSYQVFSSIALITFASSYCKM